MFYIIWHYILLLGELEVQREWVHDAYICDGSLRVRLEAEVARHQEVSSQFEVHRLRPRDQEWVTISTCTFTLHVPRLDYLLLWHRWKWDKKLIVGIGSLTEAYSSSSVSPLLPSVSAPSGLDTQSIPCKFAFAGVICIDLEFYMWYWIYLILALLHRRLQQDGLVSRRCSNASRRRTGSGSGGNGSSVSGSSNEYGEVPDPQVIG